MKVKRWPTRSIAADGERDRIVYDGEEDTVKKVIIVTMIAIVMMKDWTEKFK